MSGGFTIAVLRHGKTKANEKKLYCGFTDIGLSRTGVKEIKENVRQGIYPLGELYYTSGLRRTKETLQLIYGRDAVYKPFESLREMNLGYYDMKSYEDLKDRADYQKWISDETGFVKVPGGECRNDFNIRVRLGFLALTEEVLKSGCRQCVLVTHGGVIATVLEGLFPGRKNFYGWQPEPGLGYILTHEGEGYTGWRAIKKSQ